VAVAAADLADSPGVAAASVAVVPREDGNKTI